MPNLYDGLDTGNTLVKGKTFESMMLATFTVSRLTRTTDGQGGFTEAWAASSTFEGRLSILGAAERLSQDKETEFASHKVYCETDVDVTEEDRLTLGTRTFEVKSVQKPSNLDDDSTTHLEITVLEVDGDL